MTSWYWVQKCISKTTRNPSAVAGRDAIREVDGQMMRSSKRRRTAGVPLGAAHHGHVITVVSKNADRIWSDCSKTSDETYHPFFWRCSYWTWGVESASLFSGSGGWFVYFLWHCQLTVSKSAGSFLVQWCPIIGGSWEILHILPPGRGIGGHVPELLRANDRGCLRMSSKNNRGCVWKWRSNPQSHYILFLNGENTGKWWSTIEFGKSIFRQTQVPGGAVTIGWGELGGSSKAGIWATTKDGNLNCAWCFRPLTFTFCGPKRKITPYIALRIDTVTFTFLFALSWRQHDTIRWWEGRNDHITFMEGSRWVSELRTQVPLPGTQTRRTPTCLQLWINHWADAVKEKSARKNAHLIFTRNSSELALLHIE